MGGSVEAFLIFPEEIWEAIMETLDDSQDILNTFKAYPELAKAGVLKTKRHLWLFDQVMPHIFPWLKQKQVLFCRQVCQQWLRGVDNFLENHPSFRAYSHDSQITGQHWIPEASKENHHLRNYFRGVHLFDEVSMFSKFIKDMDKHRQERNPFIGRAISIVEDFHSAHFWTEALPFLNRFGRHIWFLRISFGLGHSVQEMGHRLRDILCHLPCLKGLRVTTLCGVKLHNDGEIDKVDELVKLDEQDFPPLPHLETLEMLGGPENLDKVFVHSYSTQIRRLLMCYHCWRSEYSGMFPNLTELQLFGITSNEGVSDLLHSLNSPNLFRLEMQLPEYGFGFGARALMHKLPKLIQKFPRLASLKLFEPQLAEFDTDGASNFNDVMIEPNHSVKSLWVWGWDGELPINLLKFQSLEYLRISSRTKLRHFGADNISDAQLWESLPKLKEINLVTGEGIKRCSRNLFEYLLRNK